MMVAEAAVEVEGCIACWDVVETVAVLGEADNLL
jgi:hypothetical protein